MLLNKELKKLGFNFVKYSYFIKTIKDGSGLSTDEIAKMRILLFEKNGFFIEYCINTLCASSLPIIRTFVLNNNALEIQKKWEITGALNKNSITLIIDLYTRVERYLFNENKKNILILASPIPPIFSTPSFIHDILHHIKMYWKYKSLME